MLFLQSSTDRHLRCFYLLDFVNKAVMNMDVQMSVQVSTNSGGIYMVNLINTMFNLF